MYLTRYPHMIASLACVPIDGYLFSSHSPMFTPNTVEIAVGYVINEATYLADLKRHEHSGRK